MNIKQLSNIMNEVVSDSGTIRDVAQKLYPTATEEQLDRRVKQISSLLSQERRNLTEGLKKRGKTDEEIPVLVNQLLPKFKRNRRNKTDELLELLNEVDNGN